MESDDKNTLDILDPNSNTIIPINPTAGDIFYDVDKNDLKIYGDNADWITIDTDAGIFGIDWSDSDITLDPVLWEERMPDPEQVKKMCEQYPALEKAYENFKTVYALVEQDWKGNHDDDEFSI